MSVPEPLILVVSLWLRGDDIGAFETFEREASVVMARHGGRIDRAIRVDRTNAPADAPFEIHLVRFPDRAAFDAYRADAATLALAPRREAVIARTVVLGGHDQPSHG